MPILFNCRFASLLSRIWRPPPSPIRYPSMLSVFRFRWKFFLKKFQFVSKRSRKITQTFIDERWNSYISLNISLRSRRRHKSVKQNNIRKEEKTRKKLYFFEEENLFTEKLLSRFDKEGWKVKENEWRNSPFELKITNWSFSLLIIFDKKKLGCYSIWKKKFINFPMEFTFITHSLTFINTLYPFDISLI